MKYAASGGALFTRIDYTRGRIRRRARLAGGAARAQPDKDRAIASSKRKASLDEIFHILNHLLSADT